MDPKWEFWFESKTQSFTANLAPRRLAPLVALQALLPVAADMAGKILENPWTSTIFQLGNIFVQNIFNLVVHVLLV